MEEIAIQINGEIMLNVDVYVKNIMFGILLRVIVKMEMFSKFYPCFSDYV